MKRILGLDLGTNSIGWALIEQDFDLKKGKIIDCGSRIIPLSQDILGKFDSGQTISQTAERTTYRSIRRLRERHILRRERLHRILNILDFLPEHYSSSIDFETRKGKFIDYKEVKFNYKKNPDGKYEFIFKDSFLEMMEDIKKANPGLKGNTPIPYDWTIYFLRNKALTKKISEHELAWIILNFNQKRGYNQLRGEDEEDKTSGKLIEFHALKVTKIDVIEEKNSKGQTVYSVTLENGWNFNKPSKVPVDWEGKIREFIVSTDVEQDGITPKLNKEGNVNRSFRSVDSENDWLAIKKKTENELSDFETVGQYIYQALLKTPTQKINGKLVRTIERKFYREELQKILKSQMRFHNKLNDKELYNKCIQELYPNNQAHQRNIKDRSFDYLIIDDILFYQRPLKSKKSLIDGCRYEQRYFYKKDELQSTDVKCIPRSNPYFQEFRLWQFISNLRIIKRESNEDGRIVFNVDETSRFIQGDEDLEKIFEFLNELKEISQKAILKYFHINEKDYRWNYVEEKIYPGNTTRADILNRLKRIYDLNAENLLSFSFEYRLWHLIYSVTDKREFFKALSKFAEYYGIDQNRFIESFNNFPPFKSEYGSLSEKAIKKLLPLMRPGKYWNKENFHPSTLDRINKLIDGEYDEKIKTKVYEKAINLKNINDFKGLPLWLAAYIVYGRHSEEGEINHWKTPESIDYFLIHEFRQHSLRNPIVEQVIAETLRVVKDIWNFYGDGKEDFFDEIHLELGREMKNPSNKRKEISKKISENENTNQRIRNLLIELKNDGIENVRPYSPGQQELLKLFEEGIYASDEGLSEEILNIRKASQPTAAELKKYRLWLEQGYVSPYTGKTIQLSRLFTTEYQIEHIIPQSRYFDDSLSNKIICEAEVNEVKGNMTAYEFIINRGGEMVELSTGRQVQLLERENYEMHVKKYFKGNKAKIKNLLSEEIPESFINRQMNDSRYISKVVKNLLSNIVREDNEMETTSKNLLPVSGSITTRMKQDWGLNDVWNLLIYKRFERLNEITSSEYFGNWVSRDEKRYFQIKVPSENSKGFNKKRIDHRHHTLDAIVIAAVTREHVNYLNSLNSERQNYSLVRKLRNTVKYNGYDIPDEFHAPWGGFREEVQEKLEKVIVSFKQNLRVINKSKNKYQKWVKTETGELKKKQVAQIKGDNWAIRKPLHKETVYGRVLLKRKAEKPVTLNTAIEIPDMIVDKRIKKIILKKLAELGNDKKVKKFFKENPITINGEKVTGVKVYREFLATASRVSLDESFDSRKISTITDTGIRNILLKHLESYNTSDQKGNISEHPELAFSEEGLEKMNKDISILNQGKEHRPILKVRIYEEGNRFPVGQTGNKKDKWVEAAKGTNLFYAVYENNSGERKYFTISLQEAVERQKQGMSVADGTFLDERTSQEYRLLFTLSPNDLVYVPTVEEKDNTKNIDFRNLNPEQVGRIYKMVSSTGIQCFFIKAEVSIPILDKIEFSIKNKMERSIDGVMIKEVCFKLDVDRLGNPLI